ncbi:LutB/LldF family L-lactate oxidation iron-sulfur protein [Desulfotalea psychrophila]|uniref:Conserved hypothetical iron-sulfur protein n=1 Tax=Desulfotalea psychrophila (strain LSv54 / DSM 12343) TaxID=177439 RepID=Q6AIU5_DESPS|nr:LutB/LldF family L-lactate oxidation iron-sulfur protein [Desulfotalea psychrophila]CAG37735.1 conserved hypothetical iron-sulfur protein [Desulfotalea psychrophila LSv54]
MASTSEFDFNKNIAEALADTELRANFRAATDTLLAKRKTIFSSPEETEHLRDVGSLMKKNVIGKLPQLLEKFEKQCIKNGIIVHWAETALESNELILGILDEHSVTKVIKGKSMTTEETHLNAYLEKHGKEIIETDFGEFILQLNNEPPSHIIVPAVHKNRKQIARVLADNLPDMEYTEDVGVMLTKVRSTLRSHYQTADAGISGVNFGIAETGTLCLVENEGNGRMCTTVPDLHIALMGVEKIVENLADIPALYRLLCGSATGQRITTYFNMISGPRKKDERDGPREVHLVLLDNGRSRIMNDPQLSESLKCIRCGTCLNHCPVFTRIGGHAYGSAYPGPIGTILTPQLEGLNPKGALATASSLCNACAEVCPVKIPIPEIIRRIRDESYGNGDLLKIGGNGYKKNLIETVTWKAWKIAQVNPVINKTMLWFLTTFGNKLPKVGPLKAWTSVRTAPKFGKQSLKDRVKKEGIRHE